MRIDVRDVTLNYGETTALAGLTFTLEPDRIYGLLGRNGSGKSSLLSVLAAYRQPTSGTVLVDGEPVFENSRVTRQICLVRESGDFIDTSDKVEKMLAFVAEMRPTWDAAYADRLLERFELARSSKINSLSRGKRSALAAVLGLATRAPLTMLDETYLGMDAPSRYILYDEILADFMEQPRTLIISTHLIEEVSRLFEEIVIIDKGRLVLHENVASFVARGAQVTGHVDEVDRLVEGLAVLNARSLGRTKSVTVFGTLDEPRLRHARSAGLDIEPVPLQDLFVHLTETARNGGRDER